MDWDSARRKRICIPDPRYLMMKLAEVLADFELADFADAFAFESTERLRGESDFGCNRSRPERSSVVRARSCIDERSRFSNQWHVLPDLRQVTWFYGR